MIKQGQIYKKDITVATNQLHRASGHFTTSTFSEFKVEIIYFLLPDTCVNAYKGSAYFTK